MPSCEPILEVTLPLTSEHEAPSLAALEGVAEAVRVAIVAHWKTHGHWPNAFSGSSHGHLNSVTPARLSDPGDLEFLRGRCAELGLESPEHLLLVATRQAPSELPKAGSDPDEYLRFLLRGWEFFGATQVLERQR